MQVLKSLKKFVKSISVDIKPAKPAIKQQGSVLNPDYTCSLPTVYFIDPGNICNLKCPFCPTGSGIDGPPKGIMPLEDFKVILEKIRPYAQNLYLYNNGEPFLNKNIYTMVRLSAEAGIKTHISSNLSLPNIDPEAIVRSGLAVLTVSIDGASQESYSKYRVGGNINLVINNIRQIEIAKQKFNQKAPEVIWQFLINKFNEHEEEKAKEMAKVLGISFDSLFMSVWDKSWQATSQDKKDGIKMHLDHNEPAKYKKKNYSLPIPVDDLPLHPELFNICKNPFNIMVIEWNGNTYPCCAAYDREAVLGNILTTGIEELWNNQKYRDCRHYLYNYDLGKAIGSICEKTKCALNYKYLDIKGKN